VGLYEKLLRIQPQVIVHDLHPDYASTRYALRRAAKEGMVLIAVQHHHAHMASCMAEHGVTHPVIGVSFDGTGYGTDGAVWGGEFLVGDLKSFRRVAHLRYVRMPGAGAAVKEPWRMALAHLAAAEVHCTAFEGGRRRAEAATVSQMIARGFNSPWTSSAGRLFDAVAALIGLRDRVSFEGQAAIQLEWLAGDSETDALYGFETIDGAEETFTLDTRPMIRGIVADLQSEVASAAVARKFHNTMVEMTLRTCMRIREMTGIDTVALSGGVFLNAFLHSHTESHLKKHGFSPLFQHQLPTNDGGISFGQLAVAASQIGATVCA
jgi:hydrogenase maturation protein HypF